MDELYSLQRCQLNILWEVDRVCTKHKIPYFLAYGTCLGAVRHQGFIPWDDDIDICMLEEDLERFKEYAKELKPPYFLQCQETDSEYGLLIARVRDSSTTLIEHTEVTRNINHGVFIDIYPLFPSYSSVAKARKKIFCSFVFRLLLYGKAPFHHGVLLKFIAEGLLRLIPSNAKKTLMKKTYDVMRQKVGTDCYSILYGGDEKVAYANDMLFPTRNLFFEGRTMPVPRQAEKYLQISYGNYMQLPPKDKQKVHHDYEFVDLNNSYLQYKGIHYCKGLCNG